MRGSNKIRGLDVTDAGERLQVHEVFSTIQGEGPFSGRRAVFVRLTGCCLKCTFCDTEWDDENDPMMSVADVMTLVWKAAADFPGFPVPLVVITGGEPTNWPLLPLVTALRKAYFPVQVETAGVRWDKAFDLEGVTVVVSPKTPTVARQFREASVDKVAWKYPLSAGELSEDGLPYTNTQRLGGRPHTLARPPADYPKMRIFVTPVDTGNDEMTARNYQAVAASAMRHGYTAQVQIHKHMRLP